MRVCVRAIAIAQGDGLSFRMLEAEALSTLFTFMYLSKLKPFVPKGRLCSRNEPSSCAELPSLYLFGGRIALTSCSTVPPANIPFSVGVRYEPRSLGTLLPTRVFRNDKIFCKIIAIILSATRARHLISLRVALARNYRCCSRPASTILPLSDGQPGLSARSVNGVDNSQKPFITFFIME